MITKKENMKVTFTSNITYNAGSYKTVVPMALVKLMNFKSGDQLNWEVDIKEDGATITVKPLPKQ